MSARPSHPVASAKSAWSPPPHEYWMRPSGSSRRRFQITSLALRTPGATALVALAVLYGVPAGELLTGRDYIVRHNFSGQEVALAVLSASPALVLMVNQEMISDEALSYIWECIGFAMARDKKRRELDEGV